MLALYRKEINLFFSSMIAYLVIAVFLSINGIFLWFLPDNILDSGYANLDSMFDLSPWVLMLLVPAITMRSFSEEYKSGTLEFLVTKPITDLQITLSKFFAGFTLTLIAIAPTLVYFLSIYMLGNPVGNVDIGGTIGSYLGLMSIAAAYVALGLLASSLSDNQIVAFILSLLLCFFFYALSYWLQEMPDLHAFESLFSAISLQSHYNSMSAGSVDTRDIFFFLGFVIVFVFLTKTKLESRKW